MKKNILFLTKYTRKGANSRYRSFQYIPYLEREGYNIQVRPLFDNKYLENIYNAKKHFLHDIFRCYLKRVLTLLSVKKFHLIIIEAELFPYILPIFERLLHVFKIPYILDYDDAIFHHYDQRIINKIFLGNKIPTIAKYAKAIITGSPYLTKYMKQYNENVYEIPTVIDLEKYPTQKAPFPNIFTIGWIGSPYTEDYLLEIYKPLLKFTNKYQSKIHLIGARQIMKEKLSPLRVEIINWSEDKEIIELQRLNVGIMPLPDTPWTRGKCGFKLIQYMATFLPVIASPVGINSKIVKENENGFLAKTPDDWLNAFEKLYKNKKLQIKMGHNGRKLVKEKYSIQYAVPIYLKIIHSLI